MLFQFKAKHEQGFSLVELMVVVGIIGILATLAMPRFKQFQAKAKMSEAKSLLNHIYTLQQSYYLDQNQYNAFTTAYGADTASATGCTGTAAGSNAIGFTIEPCAGPVPRYQYNSQPVGGVATTFSAAATTGTGAANRICPGNNPHSHNIDEKNNETSYATAVAAGTALTTGATPAPAALCPN